MNGQDSLTGLYDWRAAREKITDLLKREQVKSGLLFYMDLDDFREVNDVYGHEAGDEMLKAVGERLLQAARETYRTQRRRTARPCSFMGRAWARHRRLLSP